MPNPLDTAQAFNEMLTSNFAVVLFFVNWSKYAYRGRQLLIEAETKLVKNMGTISWWIADISNVEETAVILLREWLMRQDKALHFFPSVALGNGSVLWVKQGKVVQYVANSALLDVDAIVDRTAQATS